MSIYSEIKKYLLYLVGFFCVLLTAHLVILYLYSDAKTFALPGGTLNVGVVGNTPSMDILTVDTKLENNSTDLITHLLFRSILTYSVRDKKIVSDLATCNIDSFPVVRCSLLQNLRWSDGAQITNEDVINTYLFFAENAKNEITKSRVDLVTVSEDEGDLLFRFKTRDITMIDALFLPILKKSDMENVGDQYSLAGQAFSGPYAFESVDPDKGSVLIKKNPTYTDPAKVYYFDRIRFGFGDSEKSLKKVIKSDVIISDVAIEEGNGTLDQFIRPVFYGAFLNSKSLSTGMRKALADMIEAIKVTDPSYLSENTVFLGDVPATNAPAQEKEFEKAAQAMGFGLGGTVQSKIDVSKIVTTKPLKNINSPGNVTPLFVSQSTFEVGGNAPAGTTRIVVNEYALKNFNKQSPKYAYNIKTEFGNIHEGENNYTVNFYAGTKLLSQETVKIFHSKNKQTLDNFRSEWEKSQLPATVDQPAAYELDPKKFYRNNVPLTFKLFVQSDVPLLDDFVEDLSTKITTLGGEVQISKMPLSEIKKNINTSDTAYDIVFTGVNLGLFQYNILPFFHSGQITDGLNFSHVKNATLDGIMEKMTERFYFTAPDRLRELQVKAQKILEDEALVAPIASPYQYIWIKEGAFGIDAPNFLPGIETMNEVLAGGYFKQGFKRSEEPKTFAGFFDWLTHVLFSNT